MYDDPKLTFCFFCHRFFNNPANSQISMMILFFITGFVAVNSYFILISIRKTRDLGEALLPLFRTWPPYVLGEAFTNLASNYWERETGGTRGPLSWDVCGRSITRLYVLSPVYFLLLLILEFSSDGK